MFAIRLLPIIPYGIVNFAAGLTSIKFKDYFIGTLLGTLPGVLPFVMMGAGIGELSRGNILPLIFAFALTGILVGGATWYRRSRQLPKEVENRDRAAEPIGSSDFSRKYVSSDLKLWLRDTIQNNLA